MNVSTEDEMMEMNLGPTEEPRPVFVRKNLDNEELVAYITFLREFKDVFGEPTPRC